MSELVRGSDNERVERVFGIQCVVDRFEVEFALRDRRSRFQRLLGDVYNVDIANAGGLRRLQDNIDVIIQPVLEECVWNTNIQSFVVVFEQLRWLEPGVV